MNFIDKAIEIVSPSWAAKRQAYRNFLTVSKSYEAANNNGRDNWTPVNASAEQTDGVSRNILKAKARDLERNNDIVGAALDALIRNTVGTGIKPQARVKKQDGSFDDETNKIIEKAWNDFVKNCDITGHQTFYEIEAMILLRRIVDGEIFIKPVINNYAKNPLQIQLIESDLLDSALINPKNKENYIVGGVEVDANFKPVAYHFSEQTPDGFTGYKTVRVPANKIIHLFKKTRPTQVRGVTELARIIKRAKETNDFLDATLVAEKIRASFALLITQIGGSSGIGRAPIDPNTEKPLQDIYTGMIKYLKPGEDVKTIAPGGDSGAVKDYMQIEDRRIAAGTGQSYEVVTRDMSQTNYSSARQNHLEDRKNWIILQKYIIDHVCDPIYQKFIDLLAINGVIDITDYSKNPSKYYAVDWIAPGWSWIDPLKDVKATREELEAGITTLSTICGEQGKDWQETIDQRLRERKYEQEQSKKLGLDSNQVKGGQNNETA